MKRTPFVVVSFGQESNEYQDTEILSEFPTHRFNSSFSLYNIVYLQQMVKPQLLSLRTHMRYLSTLRENVSFFFVCVLIVIINVYIDLINQKIQRMYLQITIQINEMINYICIYFNAYCMDKIRNLWREYGKIITL